MRFWRECINLRFSLDAGCFHSALDTDLCDSRHRYRGVKHHHASAGIDSLVKQITNEARLQEWDRAMQNMSSETTTKHRNAHCYGDRNVVYDNMALENTLQTAIPRG